MMKFTFTNLIKRIMIMIGLVVVSAAAGLILLTLVNCLPVGSIAKNVEKSAAVFASEGTYPVLSESYNSQLDNYTDAEYLLISSYDGQENAFEQALMSYVFEGTPSDALISHYADGAEIDYYSYGRYWNGYQIFLRPLLMIMSYSGIRILNLIIILAGIILTCFLLWKRGGKLAIIPYLITVFLLLPWVMYKCITFCICFFVMQAAIQLYLWKLDWWEKDNRFSYLCLFSGIITIFFDLLTYPLVTLGVLLCIRFMITRKSIAEEFTESIGHCASWCLGYGLMWILKWVFITIFTDYNMFAEAYENILFRTGAAEYGRYRAYTDNFKLFFMNKFGLVLVAYVVVALIYKIIKKQINLRDLVIFGIICVFPFAWYAFANEQSWWHAFFCCKELAITSMALACMVTPLKIKSRRIV